MNERTREGAVEHTKEGAIEQDSFNRLIPLSHFTEAKRIYQNEVDDYKRDGKRKLPRPLLIITIANELKNQTPKILGKKTSHEKPCYLTSSDTAYNNHFASNSYLPPHFTKFYKSDPGQPQKNEAAA